TPVVPVTRPGAKPRRSHMATTIRRQFIGSTSVDGLSIAGARLVDSSLVGPWPRYRWTGNPDTRSAIRSTHSYTAECVRAVSVVTGAAPGGTRRRSISNRLFVG